MVYIMVGRQGEKFSSPEECQGSGKQDAFLKSLLQVGKEKRRLRAESMALLVELLHALLVPQYSMQHSATKDFD